jgi:hypothetical protein
MGKRNGREGLRLIPNMKDSNEMGGEDMKSRIGVICVIVIVLLTSASFSWAKPTLKPRIDYGDPVPHPSGPAAYSVAAEIQSELEKVFGYESFLVVEGNVVVIYVYRSGSLKVCGPDRAACSEPPPSLSSPDFKITVQPVDVRP